MLCSCVYEAENSVRNSRQTSPNTRAREVLPRPWERFLEREFPEFAKAPVSEVPPPVPAAKKVALSSSAIQRLSNIQSSAGLVPAAVVVADSCISCRTWKTRKVSFKMHNRTEEERKYVGGNAYNTIIERSAANCSCVTN